MKKSKYRVDIRRTKRSKLLESFCTDSFDVNTRKYYFIEMYQYFGKRLYKILTHNPNEKNNT